MCLGLACTHLRLIPTAHLTVVSPVYARGEVAQWVGDNENWTEDLEWDQISKSPAKPRPPSQPVGTNPCQLVFYQGKIVCGTDYPIWSLRWLLQHNLNQLWRLPFLPLFFYDLSCLRRHLFWVMQGISGQLAHLELIPIALSQSFHTLTSGVEVAPRVVGKKNRTWNLKMKQTPKLKSKTVWPTP